MTFSFAGVRSAAAFLSAALVCASAVSCTRTGTASDHDRNEVRIPLVGDPLSLNPLVTDDPQGEFVASLIHGFLLRADANAQPIPDLALRVPTRANGDVTADGQTIHYHLRHNVRWPDGVPFTSHDVAFSFAAVMNPRVNVPDRSGFDAIDSVRAQGPYDVTVHLRHAYSPAVESFFAQTADIPYPILPAHLLEHEPDLNRAAYNALPIGLGPYKVVEWRRSDRIVLEAVPGYFRGTAPVRRVVFRVIPDANTALTLWQTNELDILSTASATVVRQLAGLSRTAVHFQTGVGFRNLDLNVSRPLLRDPRVRAAVVTAIDRPALVKAFTPFWELRDGDRLPGSFAYDATIRQPAFDIARANALLDAAGWTRTGGAGVRHKDGVPLQLVLVCYNTPPYRNPAIMIQQQLAAVGIDVAIKSYVPTVLVAPADQGGILQRGTFDLAMYGWEPNGIHDDSYLFRCDSRPPKGENVSRICDPEIDREASIELATADATQEAAADKAILRRLIGQSDVVFLSGERYAFAVREGLAGVQGSVLGNPYDGAWRWHWTR